MTTLSIARVSKEFGINGASFYRKGRAKRALDVTTMQGVSSDLDERQAFILVMTKKIGSRSKIRPRDAEFLARHAWRTMPEKAEWFVFTSPSQCGWLSGDATMLDVFTGKEITAHLFNVTKIMAQLKTLYSIH